MRGRTLYRRVWIRTCGGKVMAKPVSPKQFMATRLVFLEASSAAREVAGDQPRNRRISLAEAQNWRCAYCGGEMSLHGNGPELATVEHLWGRRRNSKSCCVSACRSYNQARGDMLCIWRFRELRRRFLDTGHWPACQKPHRSVVAFLRAAVESPFLDPDDATSPAVSPWPTENCVDKCRNW